MSDVFLRQLERKWRETGALEDEAALLAQRLRVGQVSIGSLRLLAYLQHEAAKRVLVSECPTERLPRLELAGQPPVRIQQWVLGFADVCDPSDRLRVAERCIVALTRAGLHVRGPGDEAMVRDMPWAVMLRPASICWSLVQRGQEDRVRTVIREGLVPWLLGTTPDAPRPYSPGVTLAVGELVSHSKFGIGRVTRLTTRQVVIEFEDGSVRKLKA